MQSVLSNSKIERAIKRMSYEYQQREEQLRKKFLVQK